VTAAPADRPPSAGPGLPQGGGQGQPGLGPGRLARRLQGVDQPSPAPGVDARTRLRLALTGAIKARDTIAVSALRSALSAIGNAEAVDPGPAATAGAGGPYVAGAAVGVGATEARRRSLCLAEAEQIVRAEAGERSARRVNTSGPGTSARPAGSAARRGC